MPQQDLEQQDPEQHDPEQHGSEALGTESDRGSIRGAAVSGLTFFMLVLAAQIAAVPLNKIIDGDPTSSSSVISETGEAGPEIAEIDPADLDPAIYAPLDPVLIASVTDESGSARFLQLGIQVMARDQKVIDAVVQHAVAIRNNLLLLMSNRTYEEVAEVQGRERLRLEMLEEVKATVQRNSGEHRVEAIYFTAFVIQ